MFIYLFIYLYVCVCVCVCVPPPPPSSSSSPRPLTPPFTRLLTRVGVWERRGAETAGLAACDEAHLTWMKPHHRRCCMLRAPSLLMHAGVLVGPGRERRGIPRRQSCRTRGPDENRTHYTADVPGCRAVYPQEAPWVRRTKPPPPCALDLSRERVRPPVSAPSLDPSFWTLPILH